ncbi:MAG TPA: hypothetical protein VK486_14535 [Thermoleophilaceae bacterium]|nr:hypothetical protein [Thermoleophilaceae bacterium]
MPTRFALCTSLTIVLLAAPASALAADVVAPSSVVGSTTVPAGGSSTLTLRCPPTAVALNAALTRLGDGVEARSIPGAGENDWRFRLSAFHGPTRRQRQVRAVLRCVRLEVPTGVSGVRLLVSTRRPPGVRIQGGSTASLAVRCARGFIPTGYGLDLQPGRDLTAAEAMPTARGWDFEIESLGGPSGRARANVRCLKASVGARRDGTATQLRFHVARRVFSDSVGPRPGRNGVVTHSCARNQFSVATGHTVDQPDDISVTSGGPAGLRAGRWTFRAADTTDVMTNFLLCLNRHTQFG